MVLKYQLEKGFCLTRIYMVKRKAVGGAPLSESTNPIHHEEKAAPSSCVTFEGMHSY